MKRIASFSVDHDAIVPGMYVSRIDGDAVTYDLRTRKPNGGDFVPIGKGSIDWKSVRNVIEEVEYNGFVTVESGGFTDAEHAKIFENFFAGKDILEGV